LTLATSLRGKLFLGALVVAVVPLLAAGWLLAATTQARLRAAAVDDAARLGELVQVVAADRGQRLRASAQAFARIPAVRQAVLEGDRAALLPAAQEWMAQLGGPTVTVADADSAVIVRAYAPQQYGEKITTKGHLRALQGETLYSTEVGLVRGLALRGYAPIEADGRVIGVVVITQNLDQEFLETLRREVGLAAFTIFLDGSAEGAEPDAATIEAIRASGQDFSGFALVDGREQAIHAWRLTDPDGELSAFLGVVIPLDTLAHTLGVFRQTIAGVGLAAVLGSIILASLLARQLLLPLERITDAARGIAAGEPRDIPRVGSRDEVEDLSGSLAAMVEARRAAERAKDAFVSMVSHELRTPLNGIIGMTRLLLDGDLSRGQREQAEAVRRSGEGLLAILNDILDLSKIEAGMLELERVDFDLCEVVEDIIGLLGPGARDKGLALGSVVTPEVPRRLVGDPRRLCQVLTNLVGNAIKFTEQGEVVVRADLQADAADTVVIRFEVADTGVGIPAEAQGRLFEPFFQAASAGTHTAGGTGLGLTISKQLAERMGGGMGVESAPGHGSTFWFTACFARVAESPQPASVPAESARLRVLIVGDTGTARPLVQEYLASWQMDSTCADDASETVQLLRRAVAAGTPYQVALLDQELPGRAWLRLARAIRADPRIAPTRLLLMTAQGQDAGLDAEDVGIAASLTKPVRQSQMLDVLVRVGAEAVPAAVPAATVRAAPGPGNGAAGGDAPRVLVVDDSPINQQVALGMLAKLGYHGEAVGDGHAALAALARVPYAAVLMDRHMPDLDGFAATAEVRRREGPERHTPIIALTAHAMPSDRQQCLAAGMDDYVAKPILMEELEVALRRWAPLPEWSREAAVARDGDGATDDGEASPPAIDRGAWERLRRLQSPGQADVVAKYVALYLQIAPQRVAALREAQARGAAEELKGIAHTLKGEAEVIGARELQALGARLEEAADAGELGEAPALVQAIEAAWDRTRMALDAQGVGCES
jgi:signal transduction histidine kinase/DNA-binding response OmpR family regulator/HPt (histidine-containing phosphotransfer) domain-containing protein